MTKSGAGCSIGLGTMYEGFFVLTVTFFPPLLAEKKFIEMMFDDEAEECRTTARAPKG